MFYGGLDSQAGPMLRQLEQLGMGNVKFFSGDGSCTEKLPELASKVAAVGNVTCATGGISVEKMAGGQDWKKRYDAKFRASSRSTARTPTTPPWCWSTP